MGLHKFKASRAGQDRWLAALTQHTKSCVHQCEGAHKFTPTKTMPNVNTSPSMDASVNFSPPPSGSLQRKDATARAKGVLHRCVTSSHGPDWCDRHSVARHRVAKDSMAVWCMQGGSVSGAPALTRPKLLFVGLKLPLFSSDLQCHPRYKNLATRTSRVLIWL